jgi:hypothetical protein
MVIAKLEDCRGLAPSPTGGVSRAGHHHAGDVSFLWRGWSLGLALGAASLNAAVSSPSTWEALGAIYALSGWGDSTGRA